MLLAHSVRVKGNCMVVLLDTMCAAWTAMHGGNHNCYHIADIVGDLDFTNMKDHV